MLEYGRKKLYLARFPQLVFVMTSPLIPLFVCYFLFILNKRQYFGIVELKILQCCLLKLKLVNKLIKLKFKITFFKKRKLWVAVLTKNLTNNEFNKKMCIIEAKLDNPYFCQKAKSVKFRLNENPSPSFFP